LGNLKTSSKEAYVTEKPSEHFILYSMGFEMLSRIAMILRSDDSSRTKAIACSFDLDASAVIGHSVRRSSLHLFPHPPRLILQALVNPDVSSGGENKVQVLLRPPIQA
jgi:hypothetical protein